jgi:hypothetical protein
MEESDESLVEDPASCSSQEPLNVTKESPNYDDDLL